MYQSNYFLLCLLSFYFSANKHKDTDKHRALDSAVSVFFEALMK